MSHISEGLLHAHLDGAVGHDRAEEWLLAEAHLSVCEDCRRRLEEARQLRDAAGEILAGTSAPIAHRPDFEELVAKAGGTLPLPKRKPWWNSSSRLAWAASLMLAVGAGWLGRELLIQTGQDMPAVVAESEAIPQALEETAAFRDALEEDESAARRGQDLVRDADVDPTSGEREARRIAAPPGDESVIAMMQKAEGQKAADEFRQDAASPEAKVDRLEAAVEPERETGALARLVGNGATFTACYVAEDHLAGVRILGPQELRLMADGTAVASAGGTQMTGTWVNVSADSVHVSLEAGVEMRLERTATGLVGVASPAAGNQAIVDADAEAASPPVSIRLTTVECEAGR